MSDKPAFPIPDPDWKDAMHRPVEISGLTRRELFVKDLACAYIAAGSLGMPDQNTIALMAETMADILIAELDKES